MNRFYFRNQIPKAEFITNSSLHSFAIKSIVNVEFLLILLKRSKIKKFLFHFHIGKCAYSKVCLFQLDTFLIFDFESFRLIRKVFRRRKVKVMSIGAERLCHESNGKSLKIINSRWWFESFEIRFSFLWKLNLPLET